MPRPLGAFLGEAGQLRYLRCRLFRQQLPENPALPRTAGCFPALETFREHPAPSFGNSLSHDGPPACGRPFRALPSDGPSPHGDARQASVRQAASPAIAPPAGHESVTCRLPVAWIRFLLGVSICPPSFPAVRDGS